MSYMRYVYTLNSEIYLLRATSYRDNEFDRLTLYPELTVEHSCSREYSGGELTYSWVEPICI